MAAIADLPPIIRADRSNVLQERNLPRASSINGATCNRLILDTRSGATFRNPIARVKADPVQGIIIESAGVTENFTQMLTRRNDSSNNQRIWSPAQSGFQSLRASGLELSNVGISLALVTTIDGKEYAILARRLLSNGSNRLMLISGYVDAAKFFDPNGQLARLKSATNLIANAAAEGAEEFTIAQLPGWFHSTSVKGTWIRQVADELRLGIGDQIQSANGNIFLTGGHDQLDYTSSVSWQLHTTKLHPFIHNVFTPPKVALDSMVFENVGFQIHTHTNSGQIILGMRCHIDFRLREFLSFLHAEDGPLNNKTLKPSMDAMGAPTDLLATRLDREGLILVELDPHGQLTPRFFNFLEGSLRPATHLGDLGNISLSDAFVPADTVGGRGYFVPAGMVGFVDRSEIEATRYFQYLQTA